jgi:hypothetical protein
LSDTEASLVANLAHLLDGKRNHALIHFIELQAARVLREDQGDDLSLGESQSQGELLLGFLSVCHRRSHLNAALNAPSTQDKRVIFVGQGAFEREY